MESVRYKAGTFLTGFLVSFLVCLLLMLIYIQIKPCYKNTACAICHTPLVIEDLGVHEVTAYASTGNLTYTGQKAIYAYTAAKNHKLAPHIKYGDILVIDTIGVFVVTDRLPNHQRAQLDLMLPNARRFGRQWVHVQRIK